MSAIDVAVAGVPRATAAAAAACAHCGLPAAGGIVENGRPFCCAGCAGAWALLHDASLAGYYALPERRLAAVAPSGRTFEEFDHPSFEALHVRRRDDGVREADLWLEGIHCASCVWLVERVPHTLPGLATAELDLPRQRVRVAWDPAATTLSAVARRLDQLGYRAHPFHGAGAEALRRREERASLANIGIAGAIAANVMLAAVAIYSGWFGGMEREVERYFRWVSLVATTPAMIWPGRTFLRGAWAALRTRTLHMDLPIGVALAAGYLRGAWNTVTDHGPIYLDGVATLIFLLLVGRFLQQRAQRAAQDSAEWLHALSPSMARVVDDGGVREVPADAVLPGMMVEARAGDVLPADGTVIDGRSSLDLSFLTGESRPVAAGVGDRAWAGAANLDATLRVRVEASGEASRLGRLLRAMEDAQRRRGPFVLAADRLAGAFVAIVLLAALGTWAWWAPRAPREALDHAIALLVVTCPCALALATPLAFTVAIGRAARRGILVRGGDALEALATAGTLLLDKTGTVTEGRARLVEWEGAAWVPPLVLAVERHATHPLARAFREAWPETAVPEAEDVRPSPGGGVEGRVGGRRVAVGSPAFVAARLVSPPADDGAGEGLTPVWVAVDGALVARASFGDALRDDAAGAVARLRALGFDVRLLSGDAPEVVAAAGRALGLPPGVCRAAASPEDKLAAVEAAHARGPVVMVGDGVNDAAAIARATVGIGVRGGAETCLAAADVFLSRPGLAPLVELVEGARRTMRTVRLGIVLSLAYNLVGAGLAIGGRIDPLIAALLMPAASVTVVGLAWGAASFPKERP